MVCAFRTNTFQKILPTEQLLLFLSREPCKFLGVRGESFRIGAAVNELAFAAAIDEAGVLQNAKMMRNRGGSDATHGNQFAATDALPGADGLKNAQARFIGKRLGDTFHLSSIHDQGECNQRDAKPPTELRNQ